MGERVDIERVDGIVARVGRGRESAIALLQGVQDEFGWLPEWALRRVCEVTEITAAEIVGVATFYKQFRHGPVGRHVVSVCDGTACHVKGASRVYDALRRELRLGEGADTDEAGVFTVQKVACLGCCTLAPAVQIDEVTYGHLTPEGVGRMLKDFLAHQEAQKGRKRPREVGAGFEGEVRLGLGSCCVSRGSGKLYEAVQEVLAETGIRVAVKQVGCVGMCHQTPLLEVVVRGEKSKIKDQRSKLQIKSQRFEGAGTVGGTGASMEGSGGAEEEERGQDTVGTESYLYARVEGEDVREILLRHFRPAGLVRRMGTGVSRWLDRLVREEGERPVRRYGIDVREGQVAAFLGRQEHLATEFCGEISPLDLEEYRRRGGFEGLGRALGLRPGEVVDEVAASGLRGRGGAGFPTGVKWGSVAGAAGEEKYIVCNGDEGDPGAFMDRMLLESYPYRVIEGMAIAAWAVGARRGWFYVRHEYPLAVRRVKEALERCRGAGLLGEDVLGSGFSLELAVMEGAGAFVCGEESALLASIEGRRGMPRLRPPYPAERGLWGRPTLVNNVETYALTPWILRHGGEAFGRLGTERSKGTKVFALAGKIARGGLIEVPMGVTLRQVVEEIGGGVPSGKDRGLEALGTGEEDRGLEALGTKEEDRGLEALGTGRTAGKMPAGRGRFKAVQVGGPSGGCVPERLADVPIDYEALTGVGAIMGSGGLVVLDEGDCMVEIARYFLEFTQDQSCGKCTFCRVGTRRMLDILERLVRGEGRRGDLEKLEELGEAVRQGSLCGLGQTAPNPVLSTLKYFRDEYEAHLEGRCPAGQCSALVRYRVTDDCIGCTICAQQCPVGAIEMRAYEKHEVEDGKCVRCGTCREVCPVNAVIIESGNTKS